MRLPITGRYISVMRSEAPALMPIFRSQHQAALLAWLLLHPENEYTLTELAKKLDVPLTTLQREAQRLVVAGLLQDRNVGRSRLLRANPSNRAAVPLTQLLEVTFGPETVIGEEFNFTKAEHVLIFGSWADRYRGTPGPPPHDVDVLVVGDLDRADVYDAAIGLRRASACRSTQSSGPLNSGPTMPTLWSFRSRPHPRSTSPQQGRPGHEPLATR